jgi:hypothetical protein
MRTTVRLDPALLRAAKRYAAEAGTTLTAMIEDSLRELLNRVGTDRTVSRPDLPTFRGDGLHAGVRLDDSASMLDTMDT